MGSTRLQYRKDVQLPANTHLTKALKMENSALTTLVTLSLLGFSSSIVKGDTINLLRKSASHYVFAPSTVNLHIDHGEDEATISGRFFSM